MRILAFDVGTKTLSYCCLEVNPPGEDGSPPPPRVHAWETINIHEEAGLSEKAKPTMREDAEYVMNTLRRREGAMHALAPDAVVIEQQPAGGHNMFSSVRMKVLSHVIHAFFYMSSIEAPSKFVSPSSKLVGMDTGETEEDVKARQAGDRKTMGAKYRRNKRHAVDMVTLLMGTMDDESAKATFDAAKPKQDDLADAFMLAYAYGKKETQPKPTRKRKAVTKKDVIKKTKQNEEKA